MRTRQPFPPQGFLVLGVLTIAACVVFVVRAVAVEATAERLWSAILFGGLGVMWFIAYVMDRHSPTG